jgi:hypothetical protein
MIYHTSSLLLFSLSSGLSIDCLSFCLLFHRLLFPVIIPPSFSSDPVVFSLVYHCSNKTLTTPATFSSSLFVYRKVITDPPFVSVLDPTADWDICVSAFDIIRGRSLLILFPQERLTFPHVEIYLKKKYSS